MKATIVRVGDSEAILLPRQLLQQAGLSGEVEVAVGDRHLIVRVPRKPREGWSESFREMARRGDDVLGDP